MIQVPTLDSKYVNPARISMLANRHRAPISKDVEDTGDYEHLDGARK